MKHKVVFVRAQMAHLCREKVQVVLQAFALEVAVHGRVQGSSFATVGKVDFVDVLHQFNGKLLADVRVQSTAKFVGDVVLSVGKSACATKATHDCASFAMLATCDLFAVDGAFAFCKGVACFEHGNF